ncbi:GPP34 family phosphoprotein [Streptomyces sp. NPDC058045]|uniref:GOLPH3/VPS74 family protein n=1 Tax=Streptomyces sp. NPDC058045 TaxID=3346311 RepID=UPI0036E6A0CC
MEEADVSEGAEPRAGREGSGAARCGRDSLPVLLCLLAPEPSAAAPAVRAGALAELALRGLLTDDAGIATPADPDARCDDPVLDGLLELVAESVPRTWGAWVHSRARRTLDPVCARLAASGELAAHHRRVLGVFPAVSYAAADGERAVRLRVRIAEVLGGAGPLGELPAGEALLAVLAEAAGAAPGTGVERRAALTARAESTALPPGVLHRLCTALSAA